MSQDQFEYEVSREQWEEEMKHTPGPWHVLQMKNGGIGIFLGEPPTATERYVPIVLATIPAEIGGYEPERQGNANLIAAAPELLEALREIVSRNEIQHWFNLDQAKAAIAKAEGK